MKKLGILRVGLSVICVLTIFIALSTVHNVPISLQTQLVAQTTFSPVFDKAKTTALTLARTHPEKALYMIPIMASEVMPQGFGPLIDPEVKESVEAHKLFEIGIAGIVEVTQMLAKTPPELANPINVHEVAVNFEQFLIRVRDLAREANTLIAAGRLDAKKIHQIQNTELMRWFLPLGHTPGWWPQNPKETITTAVIPAGGAAVVVKEVKGMKLELVRTEIPINPCIYWPLFGRRIIVVWHIRLMPAEFVKTISYVRIRDKVEISVDKRVILEPELRDFWYFFDPVLIN